MMTATLSSPAYKALVATLAALCRAAQGATERRDLQSIPRAAGSALAYHFDALVNRGDCTPTRPGERRIQMTDVVWAVAQELYGNRSQAGTVNAVALDILSNRAPKVDWSPEGVESRRAERAIERERMRNAPYPGA